MSKLQNTSENLTDMLRVTIHSVGYIQYFKRFGPILTPQILSRAMFNEFKRMGYDVRINTELTAGVNVTPVEVVTVPIDAEEAPDEPLEVDSIDENDSTTVTEETSEEVATPEVEDTHEELEATFNNTEEAIEFTRFSKTQYKQMSEKNLYSYLSELSLAIPAEYLPLEGKNKRELLEIIDNVILKS